MGKARKQLRSAAQDITGWGKKFLPRDPEKLVKKLKGALKGVHDTLWRFDHWKKAEMFDANKHDEILCIEEIKPEDITEAVASKAAHRAMTAINDALSDLDKS